MAYTMVTKNGDMTISSWRRQLQVSFKILVSITFEVTENGGVILQEETMVIHSRCAYMYFEANSRDGGEEPFQDEACDDEDEDDDVGGVASEY